MEFLDQNEDLNEEGFVDLNKSYIFIKFYRMKITTNTDPVIRDGKLFLQLKDQSRLPKTMIHEAVFHEFPAKTLRKLAVSMSDCLTWDTPNCRYYFIYSS